MEPLHYAKAHKSPDNGSICGAVRVRSKEGVCLQPLERLCKHCPLQEDPFTGILAILSMLTCSWRLPAGPAVACWAPAVARHRWHGTRRVPRRRWLPMHLHIMCTRYDGCRTPSDAAPALALTAFWSFE
jgi:hypothetical protein